VGLVHAVVPDVERVDAHDGSDDGDGTDGENEEEHHALGLVDLKAEKRRDRQDEDDDITDDVEGGLSVVDGVEVVAASGPGLGVPRVAGHVALEGVDEDHDDSVDGDDTGDSPDGVLVALLGAETTVEGEN